MADVQLSPYVAHALQKTLRLAILPVRELGLREAKDSSIYLAAREQGAVVITKDIDFVDLQARLGPPPPIVHLQCGNTSNAVLRDILTRAMPKIVAALNRGEHLIVVA